MDSDLLEYLNRKGWKWKYQEGETQVLIEDECPFCGKTKHLMFSAETTKWKCMRCGETGNLLTIKRRLNDVAIRPVQASVFYRGKADPSPGLKGTRPPKGKDVECHERLQSSPEALEYLRDTRGFTEETIRRFRLGTVGEGDRIAITIPHYAGGELVAMKFRVIHPKDGEKKYSRWKGCPSVLFNADTIADLSKAPPGKRTVAVCEGEFDAIALSQLGFSRVVASTTGASAAFPESWLAALEPASTVYLCYDNDEPGEMGAEKAAATLGRYRCLRVVPPCHDFAEMLEQGMSRAEVMAAVRAAQPYGETIVRPIGDYAADLRDVLSRSNARGRSTGWLALDAIWGGIRDGELTVVTGDTGSGKSTWTTALARSQYLQDVPVLIAPFEQQCSDILSSLISMETGESVYEMTPVRLEEGISIVTGKPVFLIDKHGPLPLGELKDAIYIAVQRYGVRFIVLDHLHFFMDGRPEDERKVIDQIMRALALWVTDLMIHIVLVVHPAKLGREKDGATRKVVLNDLKGSSEIKKVSWSGIRVHRIRQDGVGGVGDDTEISVLKCRSRAGTEGSVVLHFDGAAQRYIEGTYALTGGKAPVQVEEDFEDTSENTGETDWERRWNEPQ